MEAVSRSLQLLAHCRRAMDALMIRLALPLTTLTQLARKKSSADSSKSCNCRVRYSGGTLVSVERVANARSYVKTA